MALASGGIQAYFSSLAHLWLTVPGKRTTLSDPWLAIGRFLTIAWIFILCFGTASLFVLKKPGKSQSVAADRTRFVWIWITPGLLFFTFVFLNYVNSGYLLVLCPPVFAFLSDRAYQFVNEAGHGALRWAIVGVGCAANVAFFVWAPLYCTHRNVREFEDDIRSISEDFRKGLKAKDTLIIGFDSHFLGYRHAGYYLPTFVTVQYPEVGYPDGKRVFVMHNGNTQLLRNFHIDRFQRFVFFPLPRGTEYTTYLSKIRGKLPEGTLNSIRIGQQAVWTGPASVIPLLFASTATVSNSIQPDTRRTHSDSPEKKRINPE
jgi:hypothetical protein